MVTFQAVYRFILDASYSVRCKLPTHYSTLLRFWPVEEFAKLAGGRGMGICLEHLCDKTNCTNEGGENTLDQT
jgi:hypothetical protein